MAKRCPKCGKELPEGASVCPDCAPAEQEERGPALFTQMTKETEGWRDRVRRERTPEQKRRTWIIVGATAAAAIAVFLLLFLQPGARVLRAVRGGRYEQAAELYWNDPKLSANGSERIDAAVLEAAERITERYAAHELDGETAARDISTLSTIGNGGDRLDEVVEAFRALNESRGHMSAARELSKADDPLGAREEYLLVSETDADYAAAQEAAKQCLADFGELTVYQADRLIQVSNFAEAVRTLREGAATLLTYDYYYEKIDLKEKACVGLLEEDLLARAAAKSDAGDPQAASDLLLEHIEEFGLTGEALLQAQADYFLLARNRDVDAAFDRAAQLFDAGNYADAFAALDALAEDPDIPAETLNAKLETLETRFAELKIEKARETFGGERDKLPDAIAILRDAMRVREVDAIGEYWDELSRYLPYSLVDEDYVEKVGVIFRNTGSFESLDGTTYKSGWIWGEDESSLSFRLDGAYDRLNAVFAVRRDDEEEASARFEILCDGKTVYTSESLNHPETESIAVEVSVKGCEVLTVRFLNDYPVSTTEDGYCYHGLCSPTVTKDIP